MLREDKKVKKKFAVTAMCIMAAMMLTVGCGEKKKDNKKTVATPSNAAAAVTVTPAPAPKHLSADEAVLTLADYKSCNFDTFSDEVRKAYAVNYYNNQVIKYNMYGMKGYDIDETKDTVADGDTVNIDFEGKIDGVAFDGGTGKDYNLEIGSGSFIDDFEAQLVGAKVGDVVTVNVTFPEDYGKEDLNGKDAEFTVTINNICIPVEITDDNAWFYIYGAEDYDSCIASLMEKEASYSEESYVTDCRNKYVKNVVDGTEFADLTAEVDAVYANIYSVYETYASNYSMTVEEFAKQYGGYNSVEDFESFFRESAERQLKGELAFEKIAAEEGITVTDEEFEAEALSTATNAGYSSVKEYETGYDSQFGSGEYRRFVNSQILQKKMFDKYVTYGEQ